MTDRTGAEAAGAGSYRSGPQGVAMRALVEHTQMCEQCTDDVQQCATGRALVRTLRETARG
ncbi:hypothetical protein OHA99_26695 [Streptomyces coelicoflavus]|uniref:hypothetical protein n=1 Tax=Streptomyces coelicoflavus TaxID=285562 RepID=UPI003253F684